MNIITSMDIINLGISAIALVISIYSVWYTRKQDKFSLEITDGYLIKIKGEPPIISFDIFNNSPSALTIEKVELLNSKNKKLTILYHYESRHNNNILNAYDSRLSSNPFKNSIIIPSNDSLELSYYLENRIDSVKIRITTNKNIHWLSKSKIFTINLLETD